MSNNKTYKVAVVGATGAVGEAMLSVLAERKFPVGELVALASERSAGDHVKFGNDDVVVRDLATFDPTGVDIALFSAGGSISKQYAPKFAAAGAVVIDNSSSFRYDDDVPLVVSEVNPQEVRNRPRGIIANPNCSTMQLMVALKPLHDAARIERINIATYQSVSGTGRKALEELGKQTAALLNFHQAEPEVYPVQIAFNVIPHGGDFTDNGYTTEEMKLVWETKKILGDDSIRVNATVVRVPVFYGHSEAVNIETRDKLDAATARALLERRRALKWWTNPGRLSDPGDARLGRGSGLRRAHPRGFLAPARAQPVGRLRQHPQGRGAERGADRRTRRRGTGMMQRSLRIAGAGR